ncbi:pentapeptide repeat-containing protein [Streptomyces sp. NPDC102476]|uniref:pentapeptide repeat-containing protein n=1 Tax=Streptomyces sp. NPDC102476 TaxID=3366181 RepID=UPI0037F3BD84
MSNPSLAQVPPDWPHCADSAHPESDPVGCRGRQVEPYGRCLAHLTAAEQEAYFDTLTPGVDVDHRATRFSGELLASLLSALQLNPNSPSTFGSALFNASTFEACTFERVTFEGSVDFSEAKFISDALFIDADFQSQASFQIARFCGPIKFTNVKYARFYANGATFEDNVTFNEVEFQKAAYCEGVTFARNADFIDTSFVGLSAWRWSRFEAEATFQGVRASGNASFDATFFQSLCIHESIFGSLLSFTGAMIRAIDTTSVEVRKLKCNETRFTGLASFDNCTFSGPATFTQTHFYRSVSFSGSTFESPQTLGPFWCGEEIVLHGTRFLEPVSISVAAQRLSCFKARWDGSSSLTLAHAEVNLASAVLMQPLSISSHVPSITDQEFQSISGTVWQQDGVSLSSLIGVDCSMLTLHDVDLSSCHFIEAIHLDQIRLEGRNTFRTPPRRRVWIYGLPFKWTQRQIIADEHHWRFDPAHPPLRRRGWAPPDHTLVGLNKSPTSLAIIYRQLRKSREDAKDEPGAADFYYGEMEMRRYDRKWSEAERWLLQSYWLLSGYGLRASRALAWLLLAMMTTVLLMMGFGLPKESPKQEASGIVPSGGGKVTFEIEKEDPQKPTANRFTGERFEKALNTTLNSVVFRSSGQDMTTAGEYIEMASRFSEPVLLGLAVLAVRGRVKR